jgi:hypothetical protein
MNARVWPGESVRWYLTRAKHPFKSYIVGHYWWWFEKFDVWIKYDGGGVINVALGDYVQQQIFFEGYYERPLVDWLKRTLTPLSCVPWTDPSASKSPRRKPRWKSLDVASTSHARRS